MPNTTYHEMYDRLVTEVTAIHQANQQRIHKGLWGMIIALVLYLTLLFVTQGSKVIILLLWIMTMFGLAAYLITIEYLNHELKKKLEHITQMEHDFGPDGADVVAESNLAKLRGMIAATPSLVDVILHRLESDSASAAAAQTDEDTGAAKDIAAAAEPESHAAETSQPAEDGSILVDSSAGSAEQTAPADNGSAAGIAPETAEKASAATDEAAEAGGKDKEGAEVCV